MSKSIQRFPTVKSRTGLGRSTIYLKIAEGTFPAPVKLGVRAVGWLESDIDSWLTTRIQETRKIKA